MKLLGIALITLGGLLLAGVWFALSSIHYSAQSLLHRDFGPGHPASVTYDQLYAWTMIAQNHAIDAERACGYLSAAFLIVIGVLLFGWAGDRKKLHSITKVKITRTV
jgi:hypothetical protein